MSPDNVAEGLPPQSVLKSAESSMREASDDDLGRCLLSQCESRHLEVSRETDGRVLFSAPILSGVVRQYGVSGVKFWIRDWRQSGFCLRPMRSNDTSGC